MSKRAASPARLGRIRPRRRTVTGRQVNDAGQSVLESLMGGLRHLRLSNMATALTIQETKGDRRPFVDRLADLVDGEVQRRADRSLERRLAAADLPDSTAMLVDAWITPDGGFDAADVARWSKGKWVATGSNLLLVGKSGCGRTWLSCAIGHAAASAGYTVAYWDVPDLLMAWYEALELRREKHFLQELLDVGLLVLDLWGCEEIDKEDARVLRRLLEPRRKLPRSVLIASNLEPDLWSAWLGGTDLAESLTRKLLVGDLVRLKKRTAKNATKK